MKEQKPYQPCKRNFLNFVCVEMGCVQLVISSLLLDRIILFLHYKLSNAGVHIDHAVLPLKLGVSQLWL